MDVNELRNEALECLHSAAGLHDLVKIHALRARAARLLAEADEMDHVPEEPAAAGYRRWQPSGGWEARPA